MFEHDTPDNVTCNLQSPAGALPSDAWHHYFHYQSSAQYLWLSETLVALNDADGARAAYIKAIFQDHFNMEAIEGKRRLEQGSLKAVSPSYDKHPLFDLEFRSLIGELSDDATKLHDEGVSAFLNDDVAKALEQFDKAITASKHHSNSYFARGKCRFVQKQFEQARRDFEEAIRLSHQRHDAYHRIASADHLARGRQSLARGELDLAISDFTKALDLYRGNKEALKMRAAAYRTKGNEKLAWEDEEKLNSLT